MTRPVVLLLSGVAVLAIGAFVAIQHWGREEPIAVAPERATEPIGRRMSNLERQLPGPAMRSLKESFPAYRLPLEQDRLLREFRDAVENDDVQRLQDVIDAGMDVNWRCPGELPPLFIAILHGRREIVQTLIQRGAAINPGQKFGVHGDDQALNQWGQTPLYFACRLGQLAVAQQMVQSGADVDATNLRHKTAFHGAVEGGHRDVFEWLLEEEASSPFGREFYADELIRSERIYGRSSPEPTRPFPEQKADPYWNLFDLAENAGDPQILQKLKELHATWIQEIPAEATDVMFSAVLRGDRETVRALLESGQKPDHQHSDWNLLHHAANRGQTEICRMLLKAGLDAGEPTAGDHPVTPMNLALRSRSVPTVKLLRDYNAEFPPAGGAIRSAISNGGYDLVRYLVEIGESADDPAFVNVALGLVNRWDDRAGADGGTSPSVRLAAYLLDKQSRLPVVDSDMRPELRAVEAGQLGLLKRIESKKAISYDDALLRAAFRGGNLELCRHVLAGGASLTNDAEADETLLRLVMVRFRNPELTEMLLDQIGRQFYPKQFDCSGGYASFYEYGNPLYHAALAGDVDYCRYLMGRFESSELWQSLPYEPYEYDSEIEYFKAGNTPLFAAVYGDHWEVVELFLTHGFPGPDGKPLAKVNHANGIGYTALHEAVNYGALRCIQLLLASGANPFAESAERGVFGGDTPMHLTIHHPRAAHSGATWPVEPEVPRMFPMLAASAMARDPQWVAFRNRRGRSILHQHAFAGHLKICESLVRLGADVNAFDRDGATPLYQAISGNSRYYRDRYRASRHQLCRFLVASGTRLDQGEVPIYLNYFHAAAYNELFEFCDDLLELGIEPDFENSSGVILGAAAADDQMDFLTRMLDMGAAINGQDNEKKTALHRAIEAGNLQISRLLIERGADVNARDRDGVTPLFSVFDRFGVHVGRFITPDPAKTIRDRLPLLTLLLDSGADPSGKTNAGKTVLQQYHNMPESYRELLESHR